MLVLGHAGITLGAATLLNGFLTGAISRGEKSYAELGLDNITPGKRITGSPGSWFNHLSQRMDLRILLVGSLLPDIIDKPLGHVFLREYLSSGRTFTHTLLFAVLMTLGGLFIRHRTGKTWLLVLSLGTYIHLILDQMWLQHWRSTILWPFYGLEFPKAELTGWAGDIWQSLLHEPSIYIPEIIGAVVIIILFWVMMHDRNLISFLKRGRLSDV